MHCIKFTYQCNRHPDFRAIKYEGNLWLRSKEMGHLRYGAQAVPYHYLKS